MRFFIWIGCALIMSSCANADTPLVRSPVSGSSVLRDTFPARSTGQLYVVNNKANSVTAYRAAANGNVSPSVTISGSSTQLNAPINLAIDAKGKTFVTNLGSTAVTVYGAGANGNAAPIAAITCGGLDLPDGIALDRAGNIYVANLQGNSISIFKGGANGCVKKTHEISGSQTQLSRPAALFISGTQLFVGNIDSHSITEYPTSARGNVAPSTEIVGSNTMLANPVGITMDRAQNLYVADDSAQAIFVFAAGTNGNQSPMRTIQGSLTQLNSPSGIVLKKGFIIVSNPAANYNTGSVTSYPELANGDVAPSRAIEGSATGLDFPVGIALH